ncbi:MAG TPA: DedA family protein [Fimbriimonadaceae bacterium]|jgi:membrane-associated protein
MPAHFQLIEFFKHPEVYLSYFLNHYGAWAYGILFAIVFCETGLVVTPFLPGDSLLFAAGLMANEGKFNPLLLCGTLIFAALLGDNVNYFLGSKLGRRLFHNEKSKIFNKKSLDKTHAFFEKYGGRTVIIARFLPVFRTFAPFVAGMGKMRYRTFMLYSLLAASLWVFLCVTIGYSVSKAPWAKDHFSIILLCLVVVSGIPGLMEIARHWRAHKNDHDEAAAVVPTTEPEAQGARKR